MLQQNIEGQFKVNEYITLRLENNITNIYVKDEPFNQCKHLLLNLDSQNLEKYDSISSIDEAIDVLRDPQHGFFGDHGIPPEAEFWGHCSNLQAWFEHDYDTRLLHRNIAFPLLKKLTEVGDPIAKKRFKEEIALRFQSGHISVMRYLIREHYLNYLNREEINFLWDDLIESSINSTERINRPKIGVILETLSNFLIKTKDPTEIIEIYESLLSLEPHSKQIWKRFTQFYTRLIKSQVDPLPSFLPPILLNPNNTDFWKHIGYYYFFNGEFSKSANAFEKTLEFEPLMIPVLVALMVAYERELEIDKSIKICDRLIRALPKNQNFLIFKNYFYLKQYLHLFPLEFYDRVIEIAPLEQNLMYEDKFSPKKRALINLGLKRLIKLSETNTKSLVLLNLITLGSIYTCALENAVKSQLKLLEFEDEESLVYSNLSYIHYLENDFSQAINYCEKALDLDPYRPDWWMFITKLYWKKGNVKEAIQKCKIGILKNPTANEIQNQLCNLYLYYRKYDDAIIVCNNLLKGKLPFSFKSNHSKMYSTFLVLDDSMKKNVVIKQDYEYAVAWKYLGYAYYKKHLFTKALIAFNNSLTYNPIQPIVNYFISKIDLRK